MRLIILFLIIVLFGCTSSNQEQNLTIATAANMQFAMKELVEAFEDQEEIEVELVISSSGKLTAQIMEGAPFDLFFSANMLYPQELYKNDLTTGKPKVYALGKLVLWSPDDEIITCLDLLGNDQIKHIAIPNPKTAPYGKAAVQVLEYYDFYDLYTDKYVFGESVSQTNQFLVSGAAEIGFTAKSVVLSEEMRDKGLWIEIDTSAYEPIQQGAVAIKNSSNRDIAIKFLSFLATSRAKIILEEYGYDVKE